MGALVRAPLYAAGALVGVSVVNQLRPVAVNAAAAVNAAPIDLLGAGRDLLSGDWQRAGSKLLGGAKAVGGNVEEQINSQVTANVITGVIAGCAVAGLIDWFIS